MSQCATIVFVFAASYVNVVLDRCRLNNLPEPSGIDTAQLYRSMGEAFHKRPQYELALRMFNKELVVREVVSLPKYIPWTRTLLYDLSLCCN